MAFDPIASSDRYFSLSGYLDASADTQWVRVEPVAPSVDPNPDQLDVAVALEDLNGGAAVAMGQVVRTFSTGPAHLFWTTADIRPGATYRLTVRRPDGAETRATVVVPDGSAEVDVIDGPFVCPTLVFVRGAARVADVQARYTVIDGGQVVLQRRFSKLESLIEEPDGALRFTIYPGDDAEALGLLSLPSAPDEVRSEVRVAVGSEDWPDVVGLDLETALVLTLNDRIENGVGFVGGVVTETVPFTPGAGSGTFGSSEPCTS